MNKQNDTESKYAPHLALFFVQLFFGMSAVLGKAALAGFPALAIVGFRAAGGALAFCLIQKFSGDLKLDQTSHYFFFAVFSLFGIILNHLLFFTGLSLTTAANASLLAITIPVFALVVSAAVKSEKLTGRKIFGVLLASGGVVYLIDPARASFSSATTIGNLLIILNSLSYAIYIVISKKLVAHYGALKSIAWIFLFGVPINLTLGLYSLSQINFSTVALTAWLALAGVVIFPTILAYYFNAWALTKVAPSTVAVYTYLQPLFGFVLAVFFLGESFSWRLFVSSGFIFAGVFLVTKRRKREGISKI